MRISNLNGVLARISMKRGWNLHNVRRKAPKAKTNR